MPIAVMPTDITAIDLNRFTARAMELLGLELGSTVNFAHRANRPDLRSVQDPTARPAEFWLISLQVKLDAEPTGPVIALVNILAFEFGLYNRGFVRSRYEHQREWGEFVFEAKLSGTLPPVQFIAILDRHVGIEPTKYRHHPGTETPHLFTFPLIGRSRAGHVVSFSLNAADLRILMDAHGLLRVQSNEPGEITLYFADPK